MQDLNPWTYSTSCFLPKSWKAGNHSLKMLVKNRPSHDFPQQSRDMFSLDISSTGASAMGIACRSQSSESGGGSSGDLMAAEGCKSRMLSYLKKLKNTTDS